MPILLKSRTDIKIENSNGCSGKIVKYIRPAGECFNRSRRVTGFTSLEIIEKVEKCIDRWYSPVIIYYKINGIIIGSNSKQNALKEYWRVGAIEDVGKNFEVNIAQ